ncbi:MAG: sigma-70 family RNA polymerase sigma factor [Gammaproteobacteria bacterium]
MDKEADNALLMDELATPLVRYLARKVPNDEDANDLAQEAFLRMHKFQQSKDLENARAFLYRTANNLVIDQQRRARVHDRYMSAEMLPEHSDEDEDKFAPSAERTVSAKEELDRIYEIVDHMPVKVRRAFLLHRGKDMSYAEIASEMNVSTSMVEKYIIQALKLIRENVA